MNLREMYEKETGEEWEIDNDKSVFLSYNYVEWLEDMIEKMKVCENCKHSCYNSILGVFECSTSEKEKKCHTYSEWELKSK